jgi:hypothetical protein
MQESGYFIDGGKGGEIFTFLSRRFLFFLKTWFLRCFHSIDQQEAETKPPDPNNGGIESYEWENGPSCIYEGYNGLFTRY